MSRGRLLDPWYEAEFYGQIVQDEPCTDPNCTSEFVLSGDPAGPRDQMVIGKRPHTHSSFRMLGPKMDGVQGLSLWCPCGFNDPKYREPNGGRPHGLIIPFTNPINAPQVPAGHGPQSTGNPGGPRPRWAVSGTGLHDLSLSPSVAVGKPECWHGFITNGEVL